MLTLKDLLEDNVDWDEIEIDDEEFERLSTELISNCKISERCK